MSAQGLASEQSTHRRVGCTNHCRSCDSHFSSEGAFDLHREGDHAKGTRHCVEPADIRDKKGRPKLVPRTHEGFCRIADPDNPKAGVTIWTLRQSMEDADRFRDLRAA